MNRVRLSTFLIGPLPKIYFNPDDLIFIVKKEKDSNVWGFTISCRSENKQDSLELILYADRKSHLDKEGTLKAIESVLKDTKDTGEQIFSAERFGLTRIFCCDKFETTKEKHIAEHSPVLEEADISRIMEELRSTIDTGKSAVSTNEWDIWKSRYPEKQPT